MLYSHNGLFNFNLLEKIKQFPSRKSFKDFTSDFQNINELKKFWILAQEKINLDQKIKFCKTHHINCKIDNFSFTDKSNTLATIYIVRDPRNLVTSISNHFSKSLEESKNFLFTNRVIGTKDSSLNNNEILTPLGSWSDHYNYWTNKNENLLVIRYEDLIYDINNEFNKLKNFLANYISLEINDEKKKNIIETTSFTNLQNMEKRGLFKESVFDKKAPTKKQFFHQGPKNNWQLSLNNKIKNEIETTFHKEMNKLGYI
tara:strand:- start:882 stop:1655 length:774 start_codon:yes stop_codon:yes gene_type:complete